MCCVPNLKSYKAGHWLALNYFKQARFGTPLREPSALSAAALVPPLWTSVFGLLQWCFSFWNRLSFIVSTAFRNRYSSSFYKFVFTSISASISISVSRAWLGTCAEPTKYTLIMKVYTLRLGRGQIPTQPGRWCWPDQNGPGTCLDMLYVHRAVFLSHLTRSSSSRCMIASQSDMLEKRKKQHMYTVFQKTNHFCNITVSPMLTNLSSSSSSSSSLAMPSLNRRSGAPHNTS